MIKEDQVSPASSLSSWPRSKLCDACQASVPLLFCIPHSAFLCLACDMELHGDGGKLLMSASCNTGHARLWICDVCENAPAAVMCAADAAALCFSCDAQVHGANSVAHRHHRSPVSPFFDCPPDLNSKLPRTPLPPDVILDQSYDADADDDCSSDADAASWFLPFADLQTLDAITATHPSCKRKTDPLATELFPDAHLLLDLQYMSSSFTDSTVPFTADLPSHPASACTQPPLSHSISSSLDVGVVPYNQHTPALDAPVKGPPASQMEPYMAREARVQRYKEKKKNRKFEKTIRYASRKAYAERRPRIKGRFAKRNETEMQQFHDLLCDIPFGVVPSF